MKRFVLLFSLCFFASCGEEAASTVAASAPVAVADAAPNARIPAAPPNAGGLPPNVEELREQYPDFVAALESLEGLTPEERDVKLEALFEANPEWRDLLPAQGERPQGGPPAGQAGPPQGGTPPQEGAPGQGAPPAPPAQQG